jgi:hypothetical protein
MPLSSRIPRLPLADQGRCFFVCFASICLLYTLTRLLAARVAMLLAELAVLPWAHHFLDITWPVYKVLGLIGFRRPLALCCGGRFAAAAAWVPSAVSSTCWPMPSFLPCWCIGAAARSTPSSPCC